MRTHQEEGLILENASEQALWLLDHRDELPPRFQVDTVDAVNLAVKFALAVKAIRGEMEEIYETRFSCGRIPART